MQLSEAQVARFNDEGYLLVDRLFSDDDLQPVIDELTSEIHTRAVKLVDEGKLSRTYEEESFETRLTCINNEIEELYWSISSGQLSGPEIFGLLAHEKMLDMVESLTGPEIIASSAYRVRPKVPGFSHGEVPWHQDSAYFDPYCDPELILTVWFPLVDATPENGCLHVIPGVHKGGVFNHSQGKPYLSIYEAAMPATKPVIVPVSKGGALLLTNRTPHYSTTNTTDVVRWSFDMRYQDAALPTNFRTADGIFRELHTDKEPVSCYPPEADLLVRSSMTPLDVIAEWERFEELRKTHVPVQMTKRWGEAA